MDNHASFPFYSLQLYETFGLILILEPLKLHSMKYNIIEMSKYLFNFKEHLIKLHLNILQSWMTHHQKILTQTFLNPMVWCTFKHIIWLNLHNIMVEIQIKVVILKFETLHFLSLYFCIFIDFGFSARGLSYTIKLNVLYWYLEPYY